jgi:hypothetical protein
MQTLPRSQGPQHRRQWFNLANFSTLHNRIIRIGRNVFEGFDFAAGPATFYRVGLCESADAEMEAEIVL